MSDTICMEEYVNTLARLWDSVYKRVSLVNGGNDQPLTRLIDTIHAKCGVPHILSYTALSESDSRLGSFHSSSWSMSLNYFKLNNPSIPSAINFMNLGETLYHEARHAEQHWLVACAAASLIREINNSHTQGPNAEKTRSDLITQISALPRHVTEKAWLTGSSFKPSSELRNKIAGWYDSMYLNRYDRNSAMAKAYANPLINDGTWFPERAGAFAPYRHSAHEADAFNVGGLINKKLGDILDAKREIPDLITFQKNEHLHTRPLLIPKRRTGWTPSIPPRSCLG